MERVDDLRPLARLVVDLLVRPGREERRERVDDGQQAVPGEPGRGRDHVLLGDPALDEAVRVRELEGAHATVGGEVGVEDDEVVALGAEPNELVAVRVDDVLVGDLRAGVLRRPTRARLRAWPPGGASVRRPARARAARGRATQSRPAMRVRRARRTPARTTSSSGAPACQRYVPPPSRSAAGCSMNETPLPLIVRATSACGRSLTSPNEAKARRGARRRRGRRRSRRASRTRGGAPRARRARRSRPSACPTAARCGRRRR